MTFHTHAARDAAHSTEGDHRVTNAIISPAPSLMFMDCKHSGRNHVVVSHDCLLISHHVGHAKIRDIGKRGWEDSHTGTTVTAGPGFGRNLEVVGATRALLAFISSDMVEAVVECRMEAARIPMFIATTPDLRIFRSLLQALQADLATGASNGPLFAESIAVAMIAAASERPVTKAIYAPMSDTVITRLPDFIAAHLHEPLTLSRIAAESGVSVRHLTASFRKTFGRSVHRYVLEQRVKRAVDLLRIDLTIAEAATLSGFADRSSLARALRNVAGLTPRQAQAGMPFRP